MSVIEEEFSADYGEENLADYGEENQADDDMGSPEQGEDMTMTATQKLMVRRREPVHQSRASMLLDNLNSDLRQRFADYTVQEAKTAFYTEPQDFRTAAMLQFLYTSGQEAFEDLHLGEEDDPANASGETPEASDARARGELIECQHNQHKRKHGQALFSSAT